MFELWFLEIKTKFLIVNTVHFNRIASFRVSDILHCNRKSWTCSHSQCCSPKCVKPNQCVALWHVIRLLSGFFGNSVQFFLNFIFSATSRTQMIIEYNIRTHGLMFRWESSLDYLETRWSREHKIFAWLKI